MRDEIERDREALTSGVSESSNGGWSESNTAKKPCPLLLVNLAMVPHTHSHRVCSAEEPAHIHRERGMYVHNTDMCR